MRNLKSALQTVLPDLTSLGGDGHNIDRERLSVVLRDLSIALRRTLQLRFALALVIIAVLAAIGWQFSSQVGPVVGSATGIALVGLGSVAALRQVTDELARVRMLLELSPDLSREALTEIARWITMNA